MSRYMFQQLKKSWNRNAKPQYKITSDAGYEALKDEARQAHAEGGHRRIEMPAYQSKDGCTKCFDF